MDRSHPKDQKFCRLPQHQEGKWVPCGTLTMQGTGNYSGGNTQLGLRSSGSSEEWKPLLTAEKKRGLIKN